MTHPEQVDVSQPRQNGHATAEQLVALAQLRTENPEFRFPNWLSAQDLNAIHKIINDNDPSSVQAP